MTFAELKAFDFPAAWAALTLTQQAEIGEATLAWFAADNLAWDKSQHNHDRDGAEYLATEASKALVSFVETAIPALKIQG